MSGRGRTIANIVFLMLFLLLALALSIDLWLNSNGFRNIVLEKINTGLQGRLSFTRHHLSPWTGRLALQGVSLTDARGEVVLTTQRLEANLSLTALLRRTVFFQSVTIDQAEARLLYNDKDQLTAALVFVPEGSAPTTDKDKNMSAWRLVIDQLLLANSRLVIQRPVHDLRAQAFIRGLSARLDSAGPSADIALDLEAVAVEHGAGQRSIASLSIKGAYRPDVHPPVSLTVTSPGASLAARGAVELRSQVPRLAIKADIDLDMAMLRQWLPDAPAMTGGAGVSLDVRGPLFDPDADMGLTLNQIEIHGVKTRLAGVALELRRRRVALTKGFAHGDWGAVDIKGGIDLQGLFPETFLEQKAGIEALGYDLTVNAKGIQPDRFVAGAAPVSGRFTLSAGLKGNGSPLAGGAVSTDLRIQGTQIRFAPAAPALDGDIKTRLVLKEGNATFTQTLASLGSLSLETTGRYSLADRRIDMRADLTVANLAELGTLTGAPPLHGEAAVRLEVSGSLDKPLVSANLRAERLAHGSISVGRLLASLRTDPRGWLHLDELFLENQGSRIEAAGRMPLISTGGGFEKNPALSMTLTFTHLQPRDFYPGLDLGGDLNGALTLTGPVSRLSAELDLARSRLQWRGFSPAVRGKAEWDGCVLTLAGFDVSDKTSALSLAGDVTFKDAGTGQWLSDPLIDARLDEVVLYLKDFSADAGGTLNGRAAVKGPLSGLSGDFSLDGGALHVKGERLSELSIKGAFADNTLRVDMLEAALANKRALRAAGWYRLDGRFDVTADARAIDLNQINALQKNGPVTGLLDFELKGSGTIDDPRIDARIDVTQPRFRERLFQGIAASINLKRRELTLAATPLNAGAALDADAAFSLQTSASMDTGAFTIAGRFEKTDLAPYLGLLAGAGWAGELTGRLDARGDWRRPLSTEGCLSIDKLLVERNGVLLAAADGLIIEHRNSVVSIPSARLRLLRDGFVTMSASGHARDGIEAALDGKIPLASLAPFSEMFSQATGELTFNARLNGPPDNPVWRADLNFQDVGFVIPGLLQEIHHINGRIHAGQDTLRIESLSAGIDKGRLDLNGRIDLEAYKPVNGNLKLKAAALPLQWPDTMDLLLNGELTLTGSPEKALLAGDLVLLEGLYYKDVRFNLLSTLTETKRAQAVPSVKPEAEWMRHIDLDVGVTQRAPFVVDNNLARMRIEPDLRLGGTLAAPVLLGRARVKEGEIVYRRKPFTIRQGIVDFVNTARIEPTIDIVSQARIRRWLVTLSIFGTPDKLSLTLDSDPPEEDNDILSLILWGSTNKELAEGKGGGGQTTEQMLAALIATSWGEDIKNVSGVDILEVETGGQDETDTTDFIQVTVGKELSRRLTVKYAVESKDGEMVQRAISEYKFLERLIGSGFQDSKGNYGGELLFRLEFR